MNKDLEFLINTGDIIKRRSLEFYDSDCVIAYTTEYHMNSKLGPLKFWITWKDDRCLDSDKLRFASIFIHDARARLYFPAYLDTRIPPENREDLDELQKKWGIKEYDKFDWVVATKAKSPIKHGLVREIEPVDCPIEEIHAIEEIVEEYQRVLK